MNVRRLLKVWVVAAAAMAVMSTDKLHAEEESAETIKQKACKFVGCGGGGQECADITMTISIPGGTGAEVTFHCYQRWGGDEEELLYN